MCGGVSGARWFRHERARPLRNAHPGARSAKGSPVSAALIEALRACVGAANVLQGDGLSAYEVDWRKRWRGQALAVVRPGTTDEVAAVVRRCAVNTTPVVAQGGNTGLVGAGVPDSSGKQVLLSLARLNRIREIDRANLTLTAEAGCVLQAVQQAAVTASSPRHSARALP